MFRRITLSVSLLLSASSAWAGLQEAEIALQKSDYATALQELRPLAIQGDAEAQVDIGNIYQFGHVGPPDPMEAAKWYRLAAIQGTSRRNIVAQNFLCWLYYDNSKRAGIEPQEGLKWCRSAAGYGNRDALFTLGLMFERRHGVVQDLVLAYAIYNVFDTINPSLHGEPSSKRLEPEMSPGQIARANELTKKMLEGRGAFIKTLDQYLNDKKPSELYAIPDMEESDNVVHNEPARPITPKALNGTWTLDLKATEKYITGLPSIENPDQVAQGIGLVGGFLLAVNYEFNGDIATISTINPSNEKREYK
ncbi:MAG: tetratricopeptide repeat protein, partial [Thiobacillaceae bacterium]